MAQRPEGSRRQRGVSVDERMKIRRYEMDGLPFPRLHIRTLRLPVQNKLSPSPAGTVLNRG